MKSVLKILFPLVLCTSANMVSASQPAVVQHLSKAIQYPTVSFQDNAQIDYPVFTQFHDFLRSSYPIVFSQLQVETIAEHSLLLTWAGTNETLNPVLFDSHFDVVPIESGTEQDWQKPPFSGAIADGYIWGRGALDDKASVIATLDAMELLLQQGFTPARPLLFSFAHDEEIGGRQGAANIAAHIKKSGIELEYMVAEGGLVIQNNPMLPGKTMAMIALAEKTYVTLTLSASGDGGHSSTPPLDNAIVRLSKAVTALHENPFEPELVSPVTDMLEALAPHVGGVQGLLFKNQWLSTPILKSVMADDRTTNALVRTTTAVTMFDAGVKENVISQNAQAKINFRLLPDFTPEQLLQQVEAIIDDPMISIEADKWKQGPPVSDINGEGYKRLSTAIETVMPNIVVVPGMLMASTDSPHYSNLAKQIYRFHPFTVEMEETGSVHGSNERIAVEAMINAVKLSAALIEAAAKP